MSKIVVLALLFTLSNVHASTGFTEDQTPCELKITSSSKNSIGFIFSIGQDIYRPNRPLELEEGTTFDIWSSKGIANWEVNSIVGRQSGTNYSLRSNSQGYTVTLQYFEYLLDHMGHWNLVFSSPKTTVTCRYNNE